MKTKVIKTVDPSKEIKVNITDEAISKIGFKVKHQDKILIKCIYTGKILFGEVAGVANLLNNDGTFQKKNPVLWVVFDDDNGLASAVEVKDKDRVSVY